MTKFKALILFHGAALALAVLTSFISMAPQIAFRAEHRSDGIYQGIEMLPDSPWTPRAREIMDGHHFGSIYYKDGKNDPYLFQPLGSMVTAYLGKAFGLGINDTILLSRAVLPFASFLLLYGFVYLLSRKRSVALAAASVLLLAEGALSGFGLFSLLQGVSPADFIRIARPVNPAMLYIFFFGFLAAFYRFWRTGDWRWGALAAVLLGANFYNYFYSWTYLYAMGGLLGLSLLLLRQWKDAWRVAAVFSGGLLLAIPWAVNLYRAAQFPTYEGVGHRLGIIYTHEPLFIGITALAAILLLLLARYAFGFLKEDRRDYLFALALLLAPVITMNQQLLTGRIMQADHYHWFFHKPMAVIFFLSIGFYLLGRTTWSTYRRALAVLLVAASVAVGAFMQFDSYTHEYGEGGMVAVERQKYGPVMAWLREHAQKEAVVLATDLPSHIVTIYTPLNVFFHRAGYISLSATEERLLEQLFTFYRLRGVGESEALEVFTKERKEVSTRIEGIYYRKLTGSYESIPQERVEEIANLYIQTLKTPAPRWIADMLAKYEVEYVLWDRKKDPLWKLEQYPFLTKAAEFGDIAIYKI